jgi:hypothetical protein
MIVGRHIELWKDGVMVRILEKEYADCDNFQVKLNNGLIDPQELFNKCRYWWNV